MYGGFGHQVHEMNIPGNKDVIMGRGCAAASHPGNVRFRVTCELYRARYDATKEKQEKSRIIMDIISVMRQSGDFLEQDALTGLWFEAENDAARKKVGQVRVCLMMSSTS
jgi:hypothetical protein